MTTLQGTIYYRDTVIMDVHQFGQDHPHTYAKCRILTEDKEILKFLERFAQHNPMTGPLRSGRLDLTDDRGWRLAMNTGEVIGITVPTVNFSESSAIWENLRVVTPIKRNPDPGE